MTYPDPPANINSEEFCCILHLLHIPFREVPPADTPWVAAIKNIRDALPTQRNAQINTVGQKDNDGDHEDEDDASSILNDGVVSDGECLLNKE